MKKTIILLLLMLIPFASAAQHDLGVPSFVDGPEFTIKFTATINSYEDYTRFIDYVTKTGQGGIAYAENHQIRFNIRKDDATICQISYGIVIGSTNTFAWQWRDGEGAELWVDGYLYDSCSSSQSITWSQMSTETLEFCTQYCSGVTISNPAEYDSWQYTEQSEPGAPTTAGGIELKDTFNRTDISPWYQAPDLNSDSLPIYAADVYMDNSTYPSEGYVARLGEWGSLPTKMVLDLDQWYDNEWWTAKLIEVPDTDIYGADDANDHSLFEISNGTPITLLRPCNINNPGECKKGPAADEFKVYVSDTAPQYLEMSGDCSYTKGTKYGYSFLRDDDELWYAEVRDEDGVVLCYKYGYTVANSGEPTQLRIVGDERIPWTYYFSVTEGFEYSQETGLYDVIVTYSSRTIQNVEASSVQNAIEIVQSILDFLGVDYESITAEEAE